MVILKIKINKTRNTDKTETTQSGALIGSNDDLLTEILHRLPVTSILRFKSVSKHWLSLLSHRCFTLMYDNLSISPGLFVGKFYIPFDVENRNTPPFRSLDFYPDIYGIRIVQSCNGLLLCCSDREYHRCRKYYVFNPTTKQFAIIPSVRGGRDARKNIRFMGLAYHKTDCVHYKLLCIHTANENSNHNGEELFQIQIYSSHKRKWKFSNESFQASYYIPFNSGVYWNGSIHWAPSCLNPLAPPCLFPSYFKLDVEQLQKLPLPSPLHMNFDDEGAVPLYLPLYFGESRGHLHLVETAYQESHLHLNVYEMLSDHSGWFVKYKVELDEFPVAFPDMINSYHEPSSPDYYEFQVCDVVRGEKDEDAFIAVRVSEMIVRYDIMDKGFKLIFLTNISYGRTGFLNVHRYTEALTCF